MRFYTWVVNTIWVKNWNDKCRMFHEFRVMNKVYTKDFYLLQWIDQLVNTTSDPDLLSFKVYYSGYNHIEIVQGDTFYMTFYVERDL